MHCVLVYYFTLACKLLVYELAYYLSVHIIIYALCLVYYFTLACKLLVYYELAYYLSVHIIIYALYFSVLFYTSMQIISLL